MNENHPVPISLEREEQIGDSTLEDDSARGVDDLDQ
jgi:hypothetical protein